MIAGIGVDVVDVARFVRSLERTPGLADRLFTVRERNLPPASLAGRFAAKEAVAKVLGAADGLAWHDCEVPPTEGGPPQILVRDTVASAAAARGIARWHLSLSHDGGLSVAMVVAES